MEKKTPLQQQLINIMQLEQAAQLEFNSAKNRLINIKKKRKHIEDLLNPMSN